MMKKLFLFIIINSLMFSSVMTHDTQHNTEEIIDFDHTSSPSAATLVKLFAIRFGIGFVSTAILNQVVPKGVTITTVNPTSPHNYECKTSIIPPSTGLLVCSLYDFYTDHISPEKPIKRSTWEQGAKIVGAFSGVLLASYMTLIINIIINTNASR